MVYEHQLDHIGFIVERTARYYAGKGRYEDANLMRSDWTSIINYIKEAKRKDGTLTQWQR